MERRKALGALSQDAETSAANDHQQVLMEESTAGMRGSLRGRSTSRRAWLMLAGASICTIAVIGLVHICGGTLDPFGQQKSQPPLWAVGPGSLRVRLRLRDQPKQEPGKISDSVADLPHLNSRGSGGRVSGLETMAVSEQPAPGVRKGLRTSVGAIAELGAFQRAAAVEAAEEEATLAMESGFESESGAARESIRDRLDQNRTRCPLDHDRLSYDEIKSSRTQPYLLGRRAKPICNNCDRDTLWSHFCQFKTHGPVCPGWLKWQLASDWIRRAEAGAPGVREMLTMTPCDLFPFMRGRTLWLVGDSLTLEWHKAVCCFLYEFWETLELRQLRPMLAQPPQGFQGWCADLAQGSSLCFLRANTGDQLVDNVLPNMAALGARLNDVMVLNFAVWINDVAAYERNVTRFAEYFEAHQARLPTAVWRDSPPQHFSTVSGDYVWPVPSQECKAVPEIELLSDNSLRALRPSAQVLAEGGWRNKIALPVMTQLGIPIMHTWNQSLPMWQYHTNFNDRAGDCTHMCHPSEYQYWVFELFRTLRTEFPKLAGEPWRAE